MTARKTVPREPTQEMIGAYMRTLAKGFRNEIIAAEKEFWQAMYDAAPTEPAPDAVPQDMAGLCARLRVIAAWLAPGGAWPVSVETLEIASREILNATDIIGAIATKQELLHRQLDNLQSAVEYWRAGRETSPET